MSFTLSSTTITQSGTDTDLTGLTGISGVTTYEQNGRRVYILDNRKLVISGTLSHDPESEEMFFENYASGITLRVNGTYNLGSYDSATGKYSSGTAIRFGRNSDSNYLESHSDIYIHSTGTLNWYGGSIHSQRQLSNYGTLNTFSQEAKLIGYGNVRKEIRQRSVNCNINGLVTKDYSFAAIANANQIENWTPYNDTVIAGFIVSSSFANNTFAVVKGLDPSGITAAVSNFWQQRWVKFINCLAGSDISVVGLSTNSTANLGLVEIRQEVRLKYTDLNFNSLDGVKVSMTDTNNGNRLAANQIQSNPDYTTDRSYTGTSSSGEVLFDTDGGVLVAVHWRDTGGAQASNNEIDYRSSAGNNTDTFTFHSCDYANQIAVTTKALKGSNGVDLEVVLVPDLSISESNKTTVDAYTELNTSAQIYDRAKSYLYDNYAGEVSTIVSKDGLQVDIGSNNLVLDGTASSVIGLSGTTLTIKSGTFTSGVKGSGTVTVSNGVTLNGGTFDSAINYSAGPSTITDVTATSIDFTQAGTYNLVGTSIGTVTNSSGGNVTLVVDSNSSVTTNTGPNITLQAPQTVINFTNLEAGSQLVVYTAGTTTELFRVNSTSTSEQYTDNNASVSYDYTVQKAGKFPIRLTGLSANNVSASTNIISQVTDRAYVASSNLNNTNVTIDTVARTIDSTQATTVQNLYSYLIEAYIAESSLRNTAFPMTTFGSSSFSLDLDFEFTSSTISLLSRDGFRYTNGTTIKAEYVAILSQGVNAGLQPEYVQTQGGTVVDTINTGNVDQVIQVFDNGVYDYRNHLVFKVQANTYRQAEFDVIDTYGTLEPTLYVISLNTNSIDGLTSGDPSITGVTLTDNTSAPVAWNAGDGVKDYSLTITDTGANSGEDILRHFNYLLSTDGTLNGLDVFQYPEMIIDNGAAYETLNGIFRKSSGDVTVGIRVIDGSGNPHPDFTRFQSDDGSYGTVPIVSTASISGLVANSRIQIYNVTTATEIVNTVNAGTGYTATYTNGTGYSVGDTIRVRATYVSGTTAKLGWTATTQAGQLGWAVVADQKDDEVYNQIGVDGSTITIFDADYVDTEIDLIVSTNFGTAELYPWWVNNLYSSDGIKYFFGGIIAEDIANFKIDANTVDLMFDTDVNSNVYQNNDARIYRSDDIYPVKAPTTGGGAIDLVWRQRVFVAEVGTSGLTASESATLAKIDGIDKNTKLIPATL